MPVWAFGVRGKFLAAVGIRATDSPSRSPVTIPIVHLVCCLNSFEFDMFL